MTLSNLTTGAINALAILCVLFTPACLFGQAVGVDDARDADLREVPIPNVAGVWVDATGTMRVREHDARKLAAERRRAQRALLNTDVQSDDLVYVSLPRLFEEARRHREAGKPLPDDLRYLRGMVKLRYLFVFPDERDLVIAGDSESVNAPGSYRPTGAITGRPVIQFDDLVVALRLMRRGRAATPFGCTIDLPSGAQDAVRDVVYGADRRPGDRAEVLNQLPAAIGPQVIKTFGAPANTRFAMVCLEADYIMKRQTIGADPPHIPQVRYTTSGSFAYNRAWFKAQFEPIRVNDDATAYAFRGHGIELDTSGSETDKTAAPANAVRFAEQFTKHFPRLARVVPAYADLANLADLALISSLLGHDRLPERVGWNTTWIFSEGCDPAHVTTPRTAETIAKYRSRSYIAGGVAIHLERAIDPAGRQRLSKLEGAPRTHRPADAWYSIRPR